MGAVQHVLNAKFHPFVITAQQAADLMACNLAAPTHQALVSEQPTCAAVPHGAGGVHLPQAHAAIVPPAIITSLFFSSETHRPSCQAGSHPAPARTLLEDCHIPLCSAPLRLLHASSNPQASTLPDSPTARPALLQKPGAGSWWRRLCRSRWPTARQVAVLPSAAVFAHRSSSWVHKPRSS